VRRGTLRDAAPGAGGDRVALDGVIERYDRSSYFVGVRKGERTREVILDGAWRLATELGLEGVTLGRLADELELSKSGLFAHFASKENLQVQTLERAAERFTEEVVRPALDIQGGERRLRTLFERWLEWPRRVRQPGGCIFVAAAAELDDRPGPARDRLVALQREWRATMARVVKRAVELGEFRRDVDPEQIAFELQGIGLACHESARLLRDPRALERARAAFERVVADARNPHATRT
jgi:AcrR family transcriptional regulator